MKTRTGFLFLLTALLLLQPRLWAQSTATLLATTDLDCTWKLDGKPQGTLKTDDATVIPLSLGKHLVQATSTDGLVQWRDVVTVTQSAQEMVEIKLKEAHQKRIAESQPPAPATPPTAAQPVPPPPEPATPQPSTPQPVTQPTEQPMAPPAAVQATQPNTKPSEDPTWTDPSTRLMWAAQDNGKNVTWPQANEYCSHLQLAGYSNWRLPSVNELAGIYDETQNVNGWFIKGGIRVTGGEWSNEAHGSDHQLFTFHNVKKDPIRVIYSRRALCVRPSEQ